MIFMAASLPGLHPDLNIFRRLSFDGGDASIQPAGCHWASVLLAHRKAIVVNGPLVPTCEKVYNIVFCLFLLTVPVCTNHKPPITGFASTVRYVFIMIDGYRGVNDRPLHCGGSYLEKLQRYKGSL